MDNWELHQVQWEEALFRGFCRWRIQMVNSWSLPLSCLQKPCCFFYPLFFTHNIRWPSCRRVLIFPKGNNVDHFSMYLDVADSANLPYGWSRYSQFSLAVVNQIQPKYTIRKGVVLLYAVLSTSPCHICALECRGKNVKLENITCQSST
jgi:hypothetical protein